MANIVEVNNPFDPAKDTVVYEVRGGNTILQILRNRYGMQFSRFYRPTICIVDGNPIPEDQWEKFIVNETGVVNFIRLQQGITALYWLYAVLIVATVALALSMPKPTVPGSTPEPDPVYDLSGQRNQTRLGNPIERPYGRNRLWVSYAAKSYNMYENNNQFLFSLYCLGQGTYDIEAIQIEDTPIDNFAEVEYHLIQPGENFEFFPDNVLTSADVGGIELMGSNEVGYPGISGPFVLTPPGTQAWRLQVDVSYPSGLYVATDKGTLGLQNLTTLFEYQQIDEDGDPLTGWLELSTLASSMATNTPQRFTLQKDVDLGRYQVRAHRTDLKNTDSKAQNTARWDAARAFLPSTKNYGDVTLLAVKIKATNNLNNNSANRINIICTAKIPVWNGSSWSAPTATRSLAWAFADVFRNQTYGGKLEDQYIDLAALLALDTIYNDAGIYFDFIFEQRGSVWESAQLVARVGRAVPMLNGSKVTMIRDFAKTSPTAVFNQENIVQGSFKWDIKLAGPSDYDGLEIEFVDPVSFLPDTVLCLVDGEEGNNPEQVKFPGCTSRDRAWQEGMYMRETELKLRENISFSTGLEGRIPMYGDLIKVVHDLPRWGTGGLILEVAGDNKTLTLNEPVDLSAGGTHKIAIRKKNGDVLGPVVATAGADAFHVVLDTALDTSDYFLDLIHEKPLFLFGPDSGNSGTLCTVVNLAPSGDDDTVEVKCVVYNPVIFSHDTDTPDDPTPNGSVPKTPSLPLITCAAVTLDRDPINPSQYVLGWIPVNGAESYRVQRSADNVNWNDETQTSATFHRVTASPGEQLYLRVAAVNSFGTGTYCSPPPPGGGVVPPVPPVGGGDYWDLIQQMSPASVVTDCKTRAGTANLIGFSEFVDPSTPPKKYLKIQGTGTITVKTYFNRTDCSGTEDDSVDFVNAGSATYDTSTGTVDCSGMTAQPCGRVNEETSVSQTVSTRVEDGHCAVLSVIHSRSENGNNTNTLSQEDREEDAIERLESTLPAWDDIEWNNDDSPGCFTSRTIRTTGFGIDIQEAKVRITTTGLNASGLTLIRVQINRFNLVTSEDEGLAEEQVFQTYADDDGGTQFEFDLPVVAGFKYYIAGMKFYQL